MAYNLAGLRASSLFRLQSHDRFTPAVVDDAINKALDDLKIFDANDFDVENCNVPVDPGDTSRLTTEWPLPDNCLYLKSVSFDGIPLDPLPQHLFVNTGTEVRTPEQSSFPRYFYVRKNAFINFFPRPSIAYADKTVQAYFVKKDQDLVDDGDVPTTKRVYTICVEFFVCWYLLQGQPEEDERASNMLQSYLRLRSDAKFNMDRNTEFQTKRLRH